MVSPYQHPAKHLRQCGEIVVWSFKVSLSYGTFLALWHLCTLRQYLQSTRSTTRPHLVSIIFCIPSLELGWSLLHSITLGLLYRITTPNSSPSESSSSPWTPRRGRLRLPLEWRSNQRYCAGTTSTPLNTLLHRRPWWQLAHWHKCGQLHLKECSLLHSTDSVWLALENMVFSTNLQCLLKTSILHCMAPAKPAKRWKLAVHDGVTNVATRLCRSRPRPPAKAAPM